MLALLNDGVLVLGAKEGDVALEVLEDSESVDMELMEDIVLNCTVYDFKRKTDMGMLVAGCLSGAPR